MLKTNGNYAGECEASNYQTTEVMFCARTLYRDKAQRPSFTNNSGTKTVFDVANLTIKVSGNDLQVTNSEGTVNMTLVDLASMQFSNTNTPTAVDNILHADAEIHVSTITGVSLGTYSSLVEACQSLSAGVYVISNGTQSQSIVVK